MTGLNPYILSAMWTGERRNSIHEVASGDDLAELRAVLGLSQRRLAWLLQTQRSAVAAVEARQRPLPDRWQPWLRALQRAGARAMDQAGPCFPRGSHEGNLTAAWRVVLAFS